MLGRLGVSLTLAVATLVGTTGVSHAALSPDATEVGIGTFVVALGFIAFLFLAYLLKRALGLVKTPPPPENTGVGGHH